ncbi:uncharacterized protein LOC110248949 [Exaiptasia diaphana]|uniref:Uncharacterized protein n=1 Tax=Exaiptasia diaphana TaxID=2652724 RepID=A0A913XX38_EXADI|nr:uncharacterized protein LOC110248949 [Exaiptasia diaphana]
MKELEKNKKAKIQENSGVIDMLNKQLGVAKEERKKYQDQNGHLRNELERLTSQHEQMMKEYDVFFNSFKGKLEENKMRNYSSTAEIESYKGKMDDLATHFAAAQEACLKKEVVIKDLERRLRTAEVQNNEELPVLKQQMEVYFNFF